MKLFPNLANKKFIQMGTWCMTAGLILVGLTGCSAALPTGKVQTARVKTEKSADVEQRVDTQMKEGSVESNNSQANNNPANPAVAAGGNQAGGNQAGGNQVVENQAAGNQGGGAVADPAMNNQPTLRWLAMGDFGLNTLSTVPECNVSGDIQRSPCMGENTKCRSPFATTCADGDCRRLFKCVTGQTNSLIWFPMGDGTTFEQAQNAQPAYGLCTNNTNVAGSACSVVNDRCLSTFCTSGSGTSCGRRVFKCLTSGIEGKFFYRWMGDKNVSELTGIPQCALQQNIAGSECFGENSKCVSSFFTDTANTQRRLFKCTP